MTFEAAGQNGPVKVCRTVYISRAVDPMMQLSPIRNRKLEQSICFPIKICLPFGSRADDQIHLLFMLGQVIVLVSDSRLVKLTIVLFHQKSEFGVKRRQDVLALGEASRDRGHIRKL